MQAWRVRPGVRGSAARKVKAFRGLARLSPPDDEDRVQVPNSIPRRSGEYEITPTPWAAHHGNTSLPAAGRSTLKGG